MYEIGSLVEMKKPHACTIKATGKKRMSGKLFVSVLILKFAALTVTILS